MKRLALLFSIVGIATGICLAETGAFTYQGKMTDGALSAKGVHRFEHTLSDAGTQTNQTGAARRAIAAGPNKDFMTLLDFIRDGEPLSFDSDFLNLSQEFSVPGLAPTTVTSATATWVGGNGDWEVASNWSPATVPNNNPAFGLSYAVVISNGSQVQLGSTPTIDSLTIGAGDRLVINQSLTVANSGPGTGTITNSGTISLNSQSPPSTTDLRISGGNVTLSGGGTISMVNAARILGSAGTDTLINQDNTIQGAGQIGANLMRLTNQGTLSANNLGSLTIDPTGNSGSATPGMVNSGTLQALQIGNLVLKDGQFDNSGGTIHAKGTTVQVMDSLISGGTVDVLNTPLAGEIQMTSSTISGGTLNNSSGATGIVRILTASVLGGVVTNGGQIIVTNAAALTLQSTGTYTNNGTISLNSTGNNTDLKISGGDVTLTGLGTLEMSGNTANRILGTTGTETFTNSSTIEGAGQIGANSMFLKNLGSIQAANGGLLTIDPAGNSSSATPGLINDGNIQASGGTLVLSDGRVNNSGEILANAKIVQLVNSVLALNGASAKVDILGAGEIQLSSSTISGNTVNNIATGIIRSVAGSNAIAINNPAGGQIIISDSSALELLNAGSITNAGTIALNSTGNNTDLKISGGNVTLTGGGSVTMSNSSGNRILGTAGTETLINQNNTIQGAGQIGANLMGMTNQAAGTISVNQSNPLTIDPAPSASFINSGRVGVNTGSTLSMGSGDPYQQTAGGVTTINGNLTANGGVDLQGTLDGAGTVTANVLNSGNVSPGALVGNLNIIGNYTQAAGSALAIDLNGTTLGTGYDQLHVVGTATLTGTLNVTRGFPATVGDGFTIIDNDGADPVNGTFNGLPEDAVLTLKGQQFQITYIGGTGNDVELTAISAAPFTTITWSNPPDITYGTTLSATQLNATASVPGTFTYTPPVGTLLNAGNSQTLAVNFTPTDPAYLPASKNVSINVLKASQTITFSPLANKMFGDPPFAVSATSSSGLAVAFSIFSGPASISGSTVTITGAGTVIVRASQAGDSNNNAAVNVDQAFSVAKASQTITFAPLPNRTVGDPPFVVSATASSGLAVTFSILSGPASITGNTITITSAGHVIVRAAQAGEGNYDAAPAIDQAFDVTSGSITVTNINNSGAGSFRQAIADAGPGATIVFAAGVRGAIILDTPASPGLGGELLINKDLTINGPGANVLRLMQESGSDDRVVHIAGGSVSISGLSISGGSDASSSQSGAGVTIDAGSTLTLNACTISRNNSSNTGGAGGLLNSGTLNITNSTVESNTGDNAGIVNAGGVLTLTNTTLADNIGSVTGGLKINGGTATILNCTISNNGSDEPDPSAVGGLRVITGSTVNIKNTIVAKNVSGSGAIADVSGTVASQGRNLVGNTTGSAGFGVNDLRNVNPQLGGLAGNGGTTETYSLLSGSPAINQADNDGAPATDQRGVARPQGGVVDIGAYESGVRPVPFGKIAFVSNGDGNDEIYSLDVNGTSLTRLTNNPANDTSPSWSRDGSKIVFTSDRDGNSEIYSMAADGSNPTRLTANSVQDLDPDWSPNGTQIVFSRGGEIFVMDADGANERQLTNFPFPIVKSHPSWSPDGAFITFQGHYSGGNYHILIIPAACSLCSEWNQMTAGSGNFISPAWSPDGNAIAYTIDDDEFGATTYISHQFDLFVSQLGIQPVASSNPKARFPAWSPDAAELVSVSDDAEGNSVNIINSDGTNPTVLFSNPISTRSSFPDWAGFQTVAGENVIAISGTVSITFSNVATNGTTTAVPINAASAGTLPGGFSLGAGLPAYEITTTAAYAPPITICINVPAVTNPIAFAQLKLLHSENGTLIDRTTGLNFSSKSVCGSVNSLSPFVIAQGSTPTAAPAVISGQIMSSAGTPLEGVVMTMTGTTKPRRTITNAEGRYEFRDVPTDGFYTVSPSRANYTFGPAQRSFSLLANVSDADFTAAPNPLRAGNAIDTAEYFVRQHYVDFLNREPDEAGFNFWSDQLLECGGDVGCLDQRRINVSAAYFLSIEFQETGGLVDGLYRTSYGRRPLFAEFMPDTSAIARDVIVNRSGWQQRLENNKQAFVDAWVQRSAFVGAYGNLSNDAYVDQLIAHTGVQFTPGERDALVNGLNATMTRATVLRRIVENEGFARRKFNEAFVMMQYFGYLRRDPDESGYQFWLRKLNEFNGNFERAEMVKAFLVSGEYRQRFGS